MLGSNVSAVLHSLLLLFQSVMCRAVKNAISKIDFLCEMVHDVSAELPDLNVKAKLLRQLVDIMLHCRKVLQQTSRTLQRERRDRRRRLRQLKRFKDLSLN